MTLNRTGVVRWLADRHGLTCTEGLLRHYESQGLLDQASGAAVYESRALAILRARQDGTPLDAIADALGVDRDDTLTMIEQDADDDSFLGLLEDRLQELVAGGLTRTQATMRLLSEDRAAYNRRRQIMLKIGKRLTAQEGTAS